MFHVPRLMTTPSPKMRIASALPVTLLVLRQQQQHSCMTAVLKGRRRATLVLATTNRGAQQLHSSSASSHHRTTSLLRQRRLQPLLDLAIQYGAGGSVVDVGTDHGLLALALASASTETPSSGCFTHVTGVDRSLAALEQGAFSLVEKQKQKPPSRLSFQQGDGLQGLGNKPGDADTVCIAGMGVHSMLRILQAEKSTQNVHRLVLQPTNSRPKNLMLLYESLCGADAGAESGRWVVQEERIEYLASRWYWTTLFVREEDATTVNNKPQLPGCCLIPQDGAHLDSWVTHHCQWIQQTQQLGSFAGDEWERRWWLQCCEDCITKKQ